MTQRVWRLSTDTMARIQIATDGQLRRMRMKGGDPNWNKGGERHGEDGGIFIGKMAEFAYASWFQANGIPAECEWEVVYPDDVWGNPPDIVTPPDVGWECKAIPREYATVLAKVQRRDGIYGMLWAIAEKHTASVTLLGGCSRVRWERDGIEKSARRKGGQWKNLEMATSDLSSPELILEAARKKANREAA